MWVLEVTTWTKGRMDRNPRWIVSLGRVVFLECLRHLLLK